MKGRENMSERTYDDGSTSLPDGSRTWKESRLVTARGEVEEANAAIGAAISSGSIPASLVVLLRDVQNDLLDIGDDLKQVEQNGAVVDQNYIDRVTSACTDLAGEPPSPETAVLAGWNSGAGLLRLARAITRRAERTLWALDSEALDRDWTVIASYINRLGDLLALVAMRADESELVDIPTGICGGPPIMSAGSAALPRWAPGRAWRYGAASGHPRP